MASEWLEVMLLANRMPCLECMLTNMDFNIFLTQGPAWLKLHLVIQAYTNEGKFTMKASEEHSFIDVLRGIS